MNYRFVLLLLLLPISGFGQSFTISGYVADSANGEALIGAGVSEKASGKGATTNRYGFFSLTLPRTDQPVREVGVNYLGYQPFLIRLHSQKDTSVALALAPAIQSLKEVMITGGTEQQQTTLGLVSIPIDRIKKYPLSLESPT